MAASSKIISLRHLLAERFPAAAPPAEQKVETGLPSLDQALGGGLRKGALTELTSPHVSAGSALLFSVLLHHASQHGQFIALIDGCDSFDPEPLGNRRLRHLLWVRCTQGREAVKAADLLLRDGNFPIVVLDLVLNAADELRKIPQTSWYRLQRLVEAVPTSFLVLTRRSLVSSAHWKLTLENHWTLADLEREETAPLLRIEVQRRQGQSATLARAS